jgi:hypothetical protein
MAKLISEREEKEKRGGEKIPCHDEMLLQPRSRIGTE